MIIKSIFSCLLLTAVIVQISWAKPMPDYPTNTVPPVENENLCHQEAEDDAEISETDEDLNPSHQLLKSVLKDFKDLSLKYTKKAKIISEQLLKDNEISNSKSATILEFKQNLTQFQGNYSLCADIDELYDLVELYSNTTSFYFELEEDSLLEEDTKLILTLLRKYGSEDLDKEFEELYNAIAHKFNKKFEDLKPDLEKEQGELGEKILEWGKDWQAVINSESAADYDDVFEAIEEFLTIFKDEEEQ